MSWEKHRVFFCVTNHVFITIDSSAWGPGLTSPLVTLKLTFSGTCGPPYPRADIILSPSKLSYCFHPMVQPSSGHFFLLGGMEGLWSIQWEVVMARVWSMVSLSSFLTSRTVAVIICRHGGQPSATVSNLWVDRPQVSPVFEPILLCYPRLSSTNNWKDLVMSERASPGVYQRAVLRHWKPVCPLFKPSPPLVDS